MGNYTSTEFSHALVQAARFGPWRKDTQLLVAELGSATFEFLSDEARSAVVETLDRALVWQTPATIEIINRYGMRNTVCGSMNDNILPPDLTCADFCASFGSSCTVTYTSVQLGCGILGESVACDAMAAGDLGHYCGCGSLNP